MEEPGRIALLACGTLFSSLNRGLIHLVEKTKRSPVLIKAQIVLFKENVLRIPEREHVRETSKCLAFLVCLSRGLIL